MAKTINVQKPWLFLHQPNKQRNENKEIVICAVMKIKEGDVIERKWESTFD